MAKTFTVYPSQNDCRFGRMFVRVCPYFPFPARIYINQHYWLANRMAEEGISFRQCANAFLRCSDPKRLQQLADSLLPYDLITCGQKWLTYLVPFFTAKERSRTGCQHRLFLSQVEYSDNLVFRRRAALDALTERLLDATLSVPPVRMPKPVCNPASTVGSRSPTIECPVFSVGRSAPRRSLTPKSPVGRDSTASAAVKSNMPKRTMRTKFPLRFA
jgi:hypothetical protein